MEDIRFTGGRHNSLAISVLRTLPASVSVMPRTSKPHHKSASYQSIYPPHSPSQDISFKRRTHQFRQIRTTRNRAPAAKGFELDILDGVGVRVDFDLQFHDVAAGGRADEAGADGGVGFGHGADIARGGVVVEDFFVVRASVGGGVEERGGEARGVWADGAGGEG